MLQYIIKPGDSLYFIALKFKTSIQSIMETNMIHDPYEIYPGQIIYIPSYNNLWPKEKTELNTPSFHSKIVIPGLLILLSLSKHIYQPGDTVSLKLFKLNLSSHPITLHYNNGQRYDFKISCPSGRTLWRWSEGKSFIQALGTVTLDVDQSIIYNESFTLPLNSYMGPYHVFGWNTSRETQKSKLFLPIHVVR